MVTILNESPNRLDCSSMKGKTCRNIASCSNFVSSKVELMKTTLSLFWDRDCDSKTAPFKIKSKSSIRGVGGVDCNLSVTKAVRPIFAWSKVVHGANIFCAVANDIQKKFRDSKYRLLYKFKYQICWQQQHNNQRAFDPEATLNANLAFNFGQN